MKKIPQGQSKMIKIMRSTFCMSWEVVENFDTSTIGPIFVCCQIDEWSM